MRPAADTPCAQCPWRIANQGKTPDPGRFYTPKNLRRLWEGLRRGARMTCHPTDVRMNEWDHMRVPDSADVRECAGALILVQREYMICQDELLDGGSIKTYRIARPRGLMKDGIMSIVETAIFGSLAGHGPKMAKPDLNNVDVGYRDLTWLPRDRPA